MFDMRDMRICSEHIDRLAAALLQVADLLGHGRCWLHDGRFHFVLPDGWSLAISLESADRLRLDACRHTLIRDTLWLLPSDHERLAGLVWELCEHATLSGVR